MIEKYKDLFNNNLDKKLNQVNLFGDTDDNLSIKEKIGFIPISVWKPDWDITKDLKEFIGDAGQTRVIIGTSKNNRHGDSYRKKKSKNLHMYRDIGEENRGHQDDGLNRDTSIFNPHLANMIISAYCPIKANIFDPFGGGGTRGFVSALMHHNYFGIELRQEEVDRIKQRQKELGLNFDIVCGDSQNYPVEKEKYNFSFTCPPYYNLEIYSEEQNDLSNAETYDEFLKMLKNTLATTYNALQKDSLAVWVVGVFRDDNGYLIPFNADTIRLAKEVGFKLLDEVIWWGASNAAAQRVGFFAKNRKSVKVHEYILVFKK